MSHAAPTEPTPERLSPWRWWVCVLLLLATILNYMDRMVLNQTALRIKLSLGLNNWEYGLLESAFSLGFAIGALAVGAIVDRVSVRWVYPLMVLGWSLAGVLTGYASTFGALLCCRLLLGLFEAGNWPCGIRTTRMILPPRERSLGNSLLQSGTALGAILTPLVLPALLFWSDPLEAQRTATMAVTGGTYGAGEGAPSLSWQVPFRLIGALGLVWIGLWFFFGPGQMLTRPASETAEGSPGPVRFLDVLGDRRFWVLFALVLGINVTWHTYRVWLPLYLQERRGFTETEMNLFSAYYYITADVGAWTVGFLTLGLSRWVSNLHAVRTLAFAGCAVLTLLGLAVPYAADGLPLKALLLVYAFGALGLFPTYFALSQEISARHQGKVTGLLGTLTYLVMMGVFAVEGWIVDETKRHELVLGAVGAIPLLVLGIMLWFWPPWKKAAI